MDIEIIIINEVSQTEEKQTPYDATYVWNLKYDTKDLIQNRLVDIKSKLVVTRRENNVGEKLGVSH